MSNEIGLKNTQKMNKYNQLYFPKTNAEFISIFFFITKDNALVLYFNITTNTSYTTRLHPFI